MEGQSIEEQVRELISQHLNMSLETVDLEMSVEEAADSLELSTLVNAVEKRFRITLQDSAIGRLRILRDLAALVRDATS